MCQHQSLCQHTDGGAWDPVSVSVSHRDIVKHLQSLIQQLHNWKRSSLVKNVILTISHRDITIYFFMWRYPYLTSCGDGVTRHLSTNLLFVHLGVQLLVVLLNIIYNAARSPAKLCTLINYTIFVHTLALLE